MMKRTGHKVIIALLTFAIICCYSFPDLSAFASTGPDRANYIAEDIQVSELSEENEDGSEEEPLDGDEEPIVTDIEAPFIPTQTFTEFKVSYTDTQGDFVRAYGSAPEGETVNFYCDSVHLGSLVADRNCVFQGNVPLSDKKSGSVYAIKAVCECEDITYEKTDYINIAEETPVVTGLRYYDSVNSDESIDLYEKMTEGDDVWVGYFGNDDPFKFVIEFSNPEAIGGAYVVAVKDGTKYRLEATYDESAGGFVAEGYFEEGNKAFSPDSINIEYAPAAFPERTFEEMIDIGEGSQVFQMIQEQLPNMQVSKSIYNEDGAAVTELICSYLDKKPEEGIQDCIKYLIKGMDYATGMELHDAYSNVTDSLSYVVKGIDEEKYLLNIDLSDPYEGKILFLNTSKGISGTAYEIIMSAFNVENTEELPIKWMEVADTLKSANAVLSYIASYEKIEKNTKEKMEAISSADYLSEEDKAEALALFEELDSDQKAFKLLSVIIPELVTGGLADVVPGVKSLLKVIETCSDKVYERRADLIKASMISVDWNKNNGRFKGITNGITLDVQYTLKRYDYTNYNNWGIPYKDYSICMLLSIKASGETIFTDECISDAFNHLHNILEPVYSGHVGGFIRDEDGELLYGIKRLELTEGITGIDNLYFYDILKLIIPDSAKNFPYSYFSGTSDLRSAGPDESYDICLKWKEEVPECSLRCFQALNSITLPKTIKYIRRCSLHNSNIETLEIPESVEYIEEEAISGYNLKKIIFNSNFDCDGPIIDGAHNLTSIGNVGSNAIQLNGMDTIPDKAFKNMNNLESVRIGAPLKAIGEGAFEECDSLKSLKIFNGEECTIHEDAFYGCDSIETVSINTNKACTIEHGVFARCNSLTELSITSDKMDLINNPFYDSDNIKRVTIPLETNCIYKYYDGSGSTKLNNLLGFLPYLAETIETAGPYGDGNVYDFTYCINPDNPSITHSFFDKYTALKSVVISENIKKIEAGAFGETSSLESVDIPNTVTEIEAGAFAESGIKSVHLPDNLEIISRCLFEDCSNLNNIELPSTIKSIQEYAFAGCGLEEIMIPISVEDIGNYAFRGNVDLRSITLPNTIKSLGEGVFGATGIVSFTIPISLDYISDGLLADCTSLESVVIHNNIKTIGNGAFAYSSIRSITIPNSVNEIGDEAFAHSDIESITISDSVNEIGNEAFCGCDNLKTIILPKNLKTISEGMFSKSGIESITIPSGVVQIDKKAFYGCESLKVLTIPDNVYYIYYEAFADSNIEEIKLPKHIDWIADKTFYNCSKLTSIIIPENVERIDSYVFGGCSNLESISLSDSVKAIEEGAFDGCKSLKDIYYGGKETGWEKLYNYTKTTGKNNYFLSANVHCINSETQTNPVIGISIDQTEITIDKNTTYYLSINIIPSYATCKEVIWASDDESIATVDDEGTVTAISEGEATITVTTVDGGYTASCKVIVNDDGEDYHDHKLSYVQAIEATCTEEGNIEYWICQDCGELFEDEDGYYETSLNEVTIPPLGHNWGEWVTLKEASETENGLEERVCLNDSSHKQTRPIPAGNHVHSLELIEGKEATCTEDGNIEYWICSECGRIFNDEDCEVEIETEDTVSKKTGHDFIWKEENIVEATCTTDGSYDEVYYCVNCGEEKSRETIIIDALGHDWGEWVVVNEPTDTEDGLKERVCLNDSSHVDTKVIPAGSCSVHSLVYVEEKGATCTEDGNYEYWICTECGKLFNSYNGENEISLDEITIPAEGHCPEESIEVIEEATCTTGGVYEEVYYCYVCGIELSRETKTLDALGHDWDEWTVTKGASCTEDGEETRTCKHDRTHVETRAIKAIGHDWSAWTTVTEPTENEDGLEVRTCKNDPSHTEQRAIPALSHTHELVKTESISATCTEDGNIEYWTCTKCGRIFSDEAGSKEINKEDTFIPATGHTEEIIPAVAPTCTETGLTEGKKCSTCGEIILAQETVPALGHAYSETVVAPTCTQEGYTLHTCARCGDSYTSDVTPAAGHKFGDWIIDSDSTCTKEGSKHRECSVCGFTEYENVDLKAHDFSDEYTIDKEPTCTEDGSKSYHCKKEGCTETTGSVVIPALGHDWSEWVTIKEATCTETGSSERVCARCGEKETAVIEALGHTWSGGYYVDVEPTYDSEGSESHHCVNCGVSEPGSERAIPKLVKTPLKGSKVTGLTARVYTSKYIKPTITVKLNGVKLVKGTDYTVTYKNNKSVGKATVTIKGIGAYEGTITKTFKINPKGTTISKLTPVTKGFKATIRKNTTQTTGYQIRYSLKSSMSGAKAVLIKSNKTLKKTVSNLKAKKKYYVQIRTYKTVKGVRYYSKWSTKMSVTTKA